MKENDHNARNIQAHPLLRPADTAQIGEKVTLMGWVNKRRDLGALIFVDLRDRTGIMQAVFDAGKLPEAAFDRAESIRSEFVLAISEHFVRRDEETVNPCCPPAPSRSGWMRSRSSARQETPPFEIDDDINVGENIRYKYRYLDLRRPVMQRRLMLRHKIVKLAPGLLRRAGLHRDRNPTLGKSTPEGARDYLVPSRVHKGKFYALPRSPALQADSDGGRVRPVLPGGPLLAGRRPARRPPAGIHPA